MENVGWFFLGIVASFFGRILFELFISRRDARKRFSNLKKELSMNLRRIKGFQEVNKKFRGLITEQRLENYFGYFQIGDFIYPIMNDMFIKGELYSIIDDDENLYELRRMVDYYNFFVQNNVNNQIKQIILDDDFEAGFEISDTLEYTFKTDIEILERILAKFV